MFAVGVNHVYYGLKSCIFVEVNVLLISRSTHQPDEQELLRTFSWVAYRRDPYTFTKPFPSLPEFWQTRARPVRMR
jgi:hypothetical protein